MLGKNEWVGITWRTGIKKVKTDNGWDWKASRVTGVKRIGDFGQRDDKRIGRVDNPVWRVGREDSRIVIKGWTRGVGRKRETAAQRTSRMFWWRRGSPLTSCGQNEWRLDWPWILLLHTAHNTATIAIYFGRVIDRFLETINSKLMLIHRTTNCVVNTVVHVLRMRANQYKLNPDKFPRKCHLARAHTGFASYAVCVYL